MPRAKTTADLSNLSNEERGEYLHIVRLAGGNGVSDFHGDERNFPRHLAFRYTLVLTYNIWRNYPLSAFIEYIFLFVQGLSTRNFSAMNFSVRFTFTRGIGELFDRRQR